MSASIWTRCGGRSNCRRLQLSGWLVVEGQFQNSTRKLVDSDDEQHVLEELIERAKPPVPRSLRALGLHFLLYTPFRHPPLRNGSRFGRRDRRGIFYGSRELETCLAEVAYYRFVFLEGTRAKLPLLEVDHTAFRFDVRANKAVDLTTDRFRRYQKQLTSKSDYRFSQALGEAMRDDGVEAFLFRSARAPQPGTNIGLIQPVFAKKTPDARMQGWVSRATRDLVELVEKNAMTRAPRVLSFPRRMFSVRGQIPRPAA